MVLRSTPYPGDPLARIDMPFGEGLLVSFSSKNLIGLELECEGMNLPSFSESGENTYWKAVNEGSLRNGGIEYIFKKPLEMKGVELALQQWDKLCVQSLTTFNNSLRTSTHIHFNALHLTPRQILTALVSYWSLENILVSLHGSNREGNLFCLRLKDAESLIHFLIEECEEGPQRLFSSTLDANYRYSAVNLNALAKFGSLEFRFLKGMYTSADLLFWIKALHSLVYKSVELNDPRKVLILLTEKDTRGYLEEFFSQEFISYLLLNFRGSLYFALHENDDLLSELVVAFEKMMAKKPEKKAKPPVIKTENEDVHVLPETTETPKKKSKVKIDDIEASILWPTFGTVNTEG